MTDTQIEKWESKIKDALLRRDNTLGDVSSSMKTAMADTFEINGTKYSLASFGIATGSYFTTDDNKHNAYHIDGNTDDSTVATNKDKLMTAITADPNTVVNFFSSLSKGLYNTLSSKMKSIDGVKSAYKVYEDKSMASEIDDYDDKIDDMEDKYTEMEDKYYKQFSAMETALSKLQSSSSSLSGLLGN
jgi:flagellar hook-associated protein 2